MNEIYRGALLKTRRQMMARSRATYPGYEKLGPSYPREATTFARAASWTALAWPASLNAVLRQVLLSMPRRIRLHAMTALRLGSRLSKTGDVNSFQLALASLSGRS